MCDPSFYLAAGRSGGERRHSFVVPDNLGYPGASAAKYPYREDGNNTFLEDKRGALRRFADQVIAKA